ncbi:MAG: NADH:flavin oxidoreductase [Sphingomonadaceae bacterium]|nr:NADH:flavin oxidoreductase [Sphingomonadaceae bacterium]
MTSTPDLSALFSPFALKSLRLRNRIVMSPMTRQFSPGGVPIVDVDGYYARRAAGGTALVITEGIAVDHPVSHYSAKIPHFYGDGPLARWRSVAAAVHGEGGAIVPQLWHAGPARRRSHTHNPDSDSMSPSGLAEEDLGNDKPAADPAKKRRPPATMTDADIEAVIESFVAGAVTAKEIGCDGAEIHGAHGYLLDQFFWERSNRRADAWGGSLENRIRIGVEIVRRTRAAVGEDFAILYRFSQWKSADYSARLAETPAALERILGPLADAGVDIFDASTRRFWLPEFEGSPLNLAGWAKKLTGKASMTVGSVGLEGPLALGVGEPASGVALENLAVLAEMLNRDDFDLVGVGRALLSNPDWADLVRSGRFDGLAAYNPAAFADTLEAADT